MARISDKALALKVAGGKPKTARKQQKMVLVTDICLWTFPYMFRGAPLNLTISRDNCYL